MASDDEVVIKVSADLATALSAMDGLKDQFQSVIDGLKALRDHAAATGESTEALDKAITAFGGTVAETLTAANQQIIGAATTLAGAAAETLGTVEATKVAAEAMGTTVEGVKDIYVSLGTSASEGMGVASDAITGTQDAAAGLSEELSGTLAPAADTTNAAVTPLMEKLQSDQPMLPGLGEAQPKLEAFSDTTKEAAVQQGNLFDTIDAGTQTTYQLAAAFNDLAEQREKERASFASFSDEAKQKTVEMSQALLDQGVKLKDVAAAAGLSVDALKLLNAEQAALKKKTEEANEAAKPFWENWLTGAKGSEVATVAFGVLVADVFKKIGSLAMDAAMAFPAFIEQMADAGDEMKTMAQRLGTTTASIAEMKYIGEQAGVSTETMARAMQGFSAALVDGSSKASVAVRGLGLSISELKKMSDTDALRTIVDRIRELPPNIDKGAKMMEVFGAKARLMTQLVGEDLGQLQQDFKDLGGLENQEALGELGDEFNDLSNNIKVASESFQRSIAVAFLPGINAILEKVPLVGGAVLTLGGAFVDLGKSMLPMLGTWALMTTSDKGLAGLTGAFEGAGVKIKTFGSDLLKLGTSIKANLIPNLILMASTIWTTTVALLASPLTWIAVAIVAVGVAIYKLVGGWEGLSKAMEPVIKYFEDIYTIAKFLAETFVGDLVRGVQELASAFSDLFSETGSGVSMLNGLLTWAEEWIAWLNQFPIVHEHIVLIKIALGAMYEMAKKISDWVQKFGDGIVGFFKRVGDEASEMAEQIRAADGAYAHAMKLADDKKKQQAAAAEGTKKEISNMERMAARVDYLNSAYGSLTAEQKKSIKSMMAAGLSTKEIAEDMKNLIYHGMHVEDATKVIDRFKDKLKEAEAEAKKDPFKKLMEDATALAKALVLAEKASIPLTEQIDEFGKKAAEIAQKAAMRGELDKIQQSVRDMATTWETQDLAKRMKVTDAAAMDLARTFNEKLATASAAVSASVAGMQGAITESSLRGTELRLAQIEREKKASLAANAEKMRQTNVDLAEQRQKEWELAEKEIEDVKASKGAITAIERAEIMVRHAAVIAGYNARNEALQTQMEDEAAIIKMNAERQRLIAEGDLAYFEEVMEARGQITKEALARQLETETKTLELMRIGHEEFSTWQIEEQQRKVDALADLGEKEAKDRGLRTKKAAEVELDILQSNLKYMQDFKEKFYTWEIVRAKEQADRLSTEFGKEAKARGLQTKADMVAQRQIAEDNLKWMIDHEKDFTKEQIKEAKERVRQAKIAAGETKMAWANAFAAMSDLVGSIGGAFEELGRQGVAGMEKLGQAITFASNVLGDIDGLMKAMISGNLVQQIIAGIKLAVTAIKGMWDAFTKSPGEDVMKRVGNRLGVAIGEELGDTIAKTAKEKFNGDRFAAEVFHLSDIIEAAGGVTEKNFEKLLGGLRDTFVLLEKKMFTVEEARETLDKNFGAFADHVVQSGKVASAAFVEMIRLNKELGVNSKEVAAFVAGQVTSLGTSFEKLVSPQLVASEDSKEVIKELREEWEKTDEAIGKIKLYDEGGVEKVKDISKLSKAQQAELRELEIMWDRQKGKLDAATASQAKMAAQAMPALDRAARLMTASFNAALSSGVGFTDAIDQLGPGLDSVLKTMENLGVEVEGSSVEWIVGFRNRVNANRELVDSAASVNDIMLAMSNIGALNEETFADLQAQGTDSYDKLRAAGFEQNEALTMMKGFLENARDAHIEMGLPMDENTAKLVEQAEQEGIIKERQLETNDIMMQGLGAIIEAVGGKIPEAWKKAEEAATGTAKTVADTFDKTVNATIEEQEKKLKQNQWDEYARDADRAALATKKSIAKIDKGLGEVQDGLDDTDWDGWAREAVDAAREVEGAVTGVAEGHSPGGIKDIPIRLAQAQQAFKMWERTGVTSATQVQDAIDAMRGRDLGVAGIRTAGIPTQVASGDFVREVTREDEGGTGRENVNLTFNITSMDPAGVELVTERKILPAMVKILRRGRNLADMQTVLNLKG